VPIEFGFGVDGVFGGKIRARTIRFARFLFCVFCVFAVDLFGSSFAAAAFCGEIPARLRQAARA
jgi:hypothetical protein